MNTQGKQSRRERSKRAQSEQPQPIRAKAAITVGVLGLVAVIAFWSGFRRSGIAGDSLTAQRDPASLKAPGQSPGGPDGQPKGKTLDEAKREYEKNIAEQQNSKEWGWANGGEPGRVMDAYDALRAKHGNSAREERVKLLGFIERGAKPRAQWPKALTESKVRKLADRLVVVLEGDHEPGGEQLTALRALAAYARANPMLQGRTRKAAMAFFSRETAVATRGAILDSLGRLGDPAIIPVLIKATRDTEYATARAATYALDHYFGTPHENKARAALLEIAREPRSKLRPLAVKLLAHRGARSVASVIPPLLAEGGGLAELEAGAYAIEKLKLKEYRGLLERRAAENSRVGGAPYLEQQIQAAFRALAE